MSGDMNLDQRVASLEIGHALMRDQIAELQRNLTGNWTTPPKPRLWWPTTYRPAHITQFLGENYSRYIKFGLPGHEGLDIRTGIDGKIICIADGTVSRVDAWPNTGAYGYSIRIFHPALGVTSIYAHLDPSIAVPPIGSDLRGGAILGKAGTTGNSSAIHLHLSIKDGAGQFIDPLALLADAYHEAGGKQELPAVKAPIKVIK